MARTPSRRIRAASELATWFGSLSPARQKVILAQFRAAMAEAKAVVEDDSNHEPVRTTHDHYHIHGEDSDAPGLDASFGHAHPHSHGKAPSTTHGPVADNNHLGHDHDGMEFDPGDDPGNPGFSRPDGLPGATGRTLKQIRDALHSLPRDATSGPEHEAYGSPSHPIVHRHVHADGKGGQHDHLHVHAGDGKHAEHEHTGEYKPQPAPEPVTGRAPKHVRFQRGQMLVLASAWRPDPQQQARIDASWEAAAETARQIGRGRR